MRQGGASLLYNTYGHTKGRSGSYSTNFQQTARELLTPDEVRLIDNGKAVLFVRGERPMLDDKIDLLKHTAIKQTEDGGAPPYDYTAATDAHDDSVFDPDRLADYELLDAGDFSSDIKGERFYENE